MAGFTDSVEQKLLDHFLTDPAYTPPTTMYLALSTTTPVDAGTNFTEPSTGAYARVATTAADWSAASGTAPAQKVNTATLTFPTATADWSAAANMTYFGLFDAATVGNLLAFGVLAVAKPVLNGDTASFAPGALKLELGDPTDTY
ncbi:MAG: phage tail fiber protein [Pseudonocardiaceae bacterium]